MLNVTMAMSLEGFDPEYMEYLNIAKYAQHNDQREIHMINKFVHMDRIFCGHNSYEAFDYALRHFRGFCMDLFTELKEGSNNKLLELIPDNISTIVFSVEQGRRQCDIAEFRLSMEDTLNKIGDGLPLLYILYDNFSNKINCTSIDDLMLQAPNISKEKRVYQKILDDLAKYGYLECDGDHNFSINNFGIYVLKWNSLFPENF